jgi:peptidyl-tRNA hydrolase, PTH2 family
LRDMAEERDPDPIVMYIVVRRSLKLSAGKVGGQCGHAVDYLTREPEKAREGQLLMCVEPSEELSARLDLLREWRYSPEHTKIILGATDEEFERVKVENPEHFLVTDLGRTQVAPNTQTCLGLWPMRRSARSPILQVLKPL